MERLDRGPATAFARVGLFAKAPLAGPPQSHQRGLAAAAVGRGCGEQAIHEPRRPDHPDRFDGDGIFTPGTLARVEMAFAAHFGKPLPVSAMGETAVHRALGFDHRGRVDVAVHPDQPEGVWLREFLTENRIPYFAFRQAVPGKATGAHTGATTCTWLSLRARLMAT